MLALVIVVCIAAATTIGTNASSTFMSVGSTLLPVAIWTATSILSSHAIRTAEYCSAALPTTATTTTPMNTPFIPSAGRRARPSPPATR